MINFFKNIIGKIKTSPFNSENSRTVNSILFLLFVSYFIVGADLSKEIARERGEFKFFAGILTNSNTVDTFAYLDFLTVNPPVVGEVRLLHLITPGNYVIDFPKNKAPPAL